MIKGTTPIFNDIDIALADKWWMCGLEYGLLATLPEKWSESCTRIMRTHKISHISLEEEGTNVENPDLKELIKNTLQFYI